MIKNRYRAVIIALVLCFVCASSLLFSKTAQAGATKVYVASSNSFTSGGINEGDFLISGGVYGSGGKAIFDENCSNTAKLIGKARINNLKDYGVQTLFSFTSTVNIIQFGEDGVFSFCFGLSSLRDSVGAEGSLEIAFSQTDGGILVECNEYFKEGEATSIVSQIYGASIEYGKPFEVQAEMWVDGTFSFSVCGRTVLEECRLSVVAEGYFGAVSVGKNTVELSETEMNGYRYDAPATVDYFEDFSQGGYNANMFYSQSTASALYPSSLSVIDGELVFRNTAQAYFSTRYTYSNFILEFDITHLQREAEYNGETLTALISNWFGIAFGVNNTNLSADETVQTTNWLQFLGIAMENTDHTKPSSTALYRLYNGSGGVSYQQNMTANGGLALWDKDAWDEVNDCINLRFTVIDGVVSLYLKKGSDPAFGKPCLSYDMGVTPTGYVRIFSWGPAGTPEKGMEYLSTANFSIDNLSITNADYEGVKNLLAEPSYKSNLTPETPDYEYTTVPDDAQLIGNKIEAGNLDMQQEETGCAGTISEYGGIGAAILCAAAGFMIAGRRKENV